VSTATPSGSEIPVRLPAIVLIGNAFPVAVDEYTVTEPF